MTGLASGLLLATACQRQADKVTPDQDVISAEDQSGAERETALSTDVMMAATP